MTKQMIEKAIRQQLAILASMRDRQSNGIEAATDRLCKLYQQMANLTQGK